MLCYYKISMIDRPAWAKSKIKDLYVENYNYAKFLEQTMNKMFDLIIVLF